MLISSPPPSDSDHELDVAGGPARPVLTPRPAGPKPKYHTPGASKGVVAQTARPRFSSSSEDEEEGGNSGKVAEESTGEIASSDLDTDFEAEGLLVNLKQIQTQARRIKPSAKAVEAEESRKLKLAGSAAGGGGTNADGDGDTETDGEADAVLDGAFSSDGSGDISGERSDSDKDVTVSKYHQQRIGGGGGQRLVRPPPLQPVQQQPLKLKIKLPPKPGTYITLSH